MNIAQIETALQKILNPFKKESFIYDLLLAYGQPKASIKRLQEGGLNLSKTAGEIIWKKKLFFKPVKGEDLHVLIDTIKADDKAIKHDPRFIIVTDFQTLLAIDRKTSDTLDIPILEIAKHFDFFLPWAGMEKAQHQNENPADVKAAERMAKLYDEIKKDNPTKTPEEVHNLNVFLSRLLFCFFAEDTGIFEKVQFTNAISSHTQTDGSDLQDYLDKLFVVMNTENSKRKNLPHYLDAFPYVNGGLFRNKNHAPAFTRRSRQALIDSGQLEWKDINPDIFGSMIQAVITPEHRGGLGMHYTSVPNIMKVIEPLFLNELNEAFEAAKGNKKALNQLLQRIWNIKLFDPACGSGNFLIIAYKELRRLEMTIFKALSSLAFSNINLSNFYGIELDDFAHEIATLSLWLAEHQMNQEFFKEFGRTKPALPLKETGNIVRDNATRIDWEAVCPKKEGDEIYILGNPPYLGFKMQNKTQKEEIMGVFNGIEGFKKLDYISCWFLKSAEFIEGTHNSFAFVSTNSVCQGEHVSLLWPNIFNKGLEIGFAHTSFKWDNNAKNNAGVICVIVGARTISKKNKYIFSEGKSTLVKSINSYLSASGNDIVYKRNSPISDFPKMFLGNMPKDDGNLILTTEEKNNLLRAHPECSNIIRLLVGAYEFLNGGERWCLWIKKENLNEATKIKQVNDRINKVKDFRLASTDTAANEMGRTPYKFREQHEPKNFSIIIPTVTSERRTYIPLGYLNKDAVIVAPNNAIYDPEGYIFSVLSSKMHMAWVKTFAGRLKTDYRYSSALCYNTFPFPPISQTQKQELEKNVYRILEERENHSEKTLAQLYDPNKMPPGLKEAHHQNDLAVERCYRSKPFETDEERLGYLFKLYEQMIAEEQTKGTLFEVEKRLKKKKK
ncbi:MAG: SAM-dependent methyltransferase [Flavobacterium psychrophilum]|nr:MAG: SAM-dependent methyltransferase [Flavobacterium psychrophilum]